MSIWVGGLWVLFSLSLSANAFLLFWLKKTKRTNPKTYTYDAQALMQDLLAGDGLVRVSRVAPQDVLLRSPRDRP